MIKCHHGYSKKSCRECAGERKIIKQEMSVDKAQAAIIIKAMDWFDSVRFENPRNLSDQEIDLRMACSELAKIYNKKIKKD